MKVRPMQDSDLDVVVELEKTVFPDPWSRISFEYELKSNPYSLPLILEHMGEIAGYAIIWRIFEEFHIANIAVHPNLQGRKMGSYFLRHILSLKENCSYAILEVRESNQRAIHLYENFGFNIIMKRTRYYRNGETALVMQKIFSKEND
ncbi:MAG: ribosomal protein S18-alanine N-acetyltransferase [Calditrichaeota bacterium]|nr:ribosomal protein S18-alanine N-acetyltransferase [Calditrichota bacterium]